MWRSFKHDYKAAIETAFELLCSFLITHLESKGLQFLHDTTVLRFAIETEFPLAHVAVLPLIKIWVGAYGLPRAGCFITSFFFKFFF